MTMADFRVKKGVIIGVVAVLLLADGALAYFNVKMSVPR